MGTEHVFNHNNVGIINKDTIYKDIVKGHTKVIINNCSTNGYVMNFMALGHKKFRDYENIGKTDYMFNLPNSYLTVYSKDFESIKKKVKDKEIGKDLYFVISTTKKLEEKTYSEYWLQELKNYNFEFKYLKELTDDSFYEYKNLIVEKDLETKKETFKIVISTIQDLKIRETIKTTIKVKQRFFSLETDLIEQKTRIVSSILMEKNIQTVILDTKIKESTKVYEAKVNTIQDSEEINTVIKEHKQYENSLYIPVSTPYENQEYWHIIYKVQQEDLSYKQKLFISKLEGAQNIGFEKPAYPVVILRHGYEDILTKYENTKKCYNYVCKFLDKPLHGLTDVAKRNYMKKFLKKDLCEKGYEYFHYGVFFYEEIKKLYSLTINISNLKYIFRLFQYFCYNDLFLRHNFSSIQPLDTRENPYRVTNICMNTQAAFTKNVSKAKIEEVKQKYPYTKCYEDFETFCKNHYDTFGTLINIYNKESKEFKLAFFEILQSYCYLFYIFYYYYKKENKNGNITVYDIFHAAFSIAQEDIEILPHLQMYFACGKLGIDSMWRGNNYKFNPRPKADLYHWFYSKGLYVKQWKEENDKLLNSIGLDQKDLVEAYTKDDTARKHTEYAYVFLGCLVESGNWAVNKYLFSFFEQFEPYLTKNFPTSFCWYERELHYKWNTYFTIEKVYFTKGRIYKDSYQGNCTFEKFTRLELLDFDSFDKEDNFFKRCYKYYDLTRDPNTGLTNPDLLEQYIDEIYTFCLTEKQVYLFKKQIDDDTIKVIQVSNFFSETYMGEKEYAVYKNDKLVIPLLIETVNSLSLMEKTSLYYYAPQLSLYVHQKIDVPWYASGLFSAILIIIAVVCAVFTAGQSLWLVGVAFATSITAGLIALGTLILKILILYGISRLIMRFLDYVIDDPVLKAVITSVLTVIVGAMTGMIDTSNLMLTIAELCNVCSEVLNVYIGDMKDKLENNMKDFSKKYEKRMEEFSSIMEGFDIGLNVVDVADLTLNIDGFSGSSKPISSTVMSPSAFFYAATNQAAYNLDLIFTEQYNNMTHSFVNNQLKLGIF